MNKLYVRLFSSFTIFITFCCLYGCRQNSFSIITKPSHPKLIVGIVVDQMAFDYYERYKGKFSSGGFKRIFESGYDCTNTYFEHFPTYTGPGHSTIYSGSDPGMSGIVANDWYEKTSRKNMYCTEDDSVSTVGSFSAAGKMSPKNMLVTTMGDRLRLTSNFRSKVIGIALKDRGAILPAGHFANASYWYDAASKNWITSSYYMDQLPDWVNNFNSKHLADKYLDTVWNTLLPISEYSESTPDDNNYEKMYAGEDKPVFPHNLRELKYRNNSLLQYSPFGNSITKDLAIETIKNENMGKGNFTDMLCISFSSTDYVSHMFGPYSIETEDTYLRLDRDIEELLNSIDYHIGFENTLLFLTADHGNSPNPRFLIDHKSDAGAFYYREIKDSCSSYLKKTFSIENGIADVINQQIYLNSPPLSGSKFPKNQIEDSLAVYINRSIKGVENVYPDYVIMNQDKNDLLFKAFQNGYYEKRSGDIFINFRPYWIEETLKGTEHGSPYNYDRHVPLVFYGWKVNKGETAEYNSVKDIVPTLSYFLNIDVPEKSTGKPIEPLIRNMSR